MHVYGYDFAYDGVYGIGVTARTVRFAYVDTETGEVERPAFDIELLNPYQIESCDNSSLEAIFFKLPIPYEMNLDGIDVLIKIKGGYLRLDPYHYDYGIEYDEIGTIVNTSVVFKYTELRGFV